MKSKISFALLTVLFSFFIQILGNYAPNDGNEENNPLVDNVKIRFCQIPEFSSTLGAWTNNIIKYPDYTYKNNNFDFSSNQIDDFNFYSNQFQGIARGPNHLKLGNYLFLCGGNPQKGTADLFVVELKNQDYHIWINNLYSGLEDKTKQGKPANIDDCFIKHIILEKGSSYQSGGISVCGKYLAIPMSGDHRTKISFYDISHPTSPQKVGHSIRRENSLESCSVAMTRLECGHFFIALWSDMFGLYFYLSKGKTLENGFKEISHTEMGFFRQFKLAYRNISLVQDFNNHVFLIGTQNVSSDTAKTCLENIADLFSIKKEKDNTITLNYIERKIFSARKTSNFNAACSVYVADSENIWLYSCHNFLCEDTPNNVGLWSMRKTTNPNLFITFDQYGRINDSL